MFSSVLYTLPACRSLKAAENQLLRASESLYLISTFFIPLDRRGTQSSTTTHIGSINAVIAFVVYGSDYRHVRSRTSRLNTSYIDRRNTQFIVKIKVRIFEV